jgi:hypothetical protein
MTVEIRRDLPRMHAQLHLRLVHAAVGTYPYHAEKASLPENRLLLVGMLAEMSHMRQDVFFSRFFKQHTGLSPREFQRSNGGLTRDAP